MNYRYILEKYSGGKSRYTCPECDKKGTFTRYIDVEKEEYLDPRVGRCNRENKCGYHYMPKDYFSDHNLTDNNFKINYTPQAKPKPVSFINYEDFESTLDNYSENKFIQYLLDNFNEEQVKEAIEKYFIGTLNRPWNGSTVFWQIDIKGRVKAGKIMLYDSGTGKRVKEPHSHLSWYHSVSKSKYSDFNIEQCLFGEHLLSDKSKPVAVVESEKTAVICSIAFPKHIWLATGGISNLKEQNCKNLDGRRVILYPDSDAVEDWSNKLKGISSLNNARVSRVFQDLDIDDGMDLADWI
ncbi:DUF6371 domain-containing protein [Bacteroidia bacterium]|nr:DUF6371 domain-containing protein [Bacteroidia bacterium]